jgi:hypothetical protein
VYRLPAAPDDRRRFAFIEVAVHGIADGLFQLGDRFSFSKD